MGNEPRIGDAFGMTLQRCWAAGAAPGAAFEIIERDDGHISVADARRYFTPADELAPLDREAVEFAAGRIVDIGVGAGRHALALQDLGKDVLGIDPSPGAVQVARDRGVDARLGTIADPPADLGVFDTLLLLGNNLGLLQGRDRAPEVLAQLARLARPGALLVGTGMDPTTTADADHRAYQDRNRSLERLPGQIRMRNRYGTLATEWFDYLLAGVHELRELIHRSPWRVVTVRGGRRYLMVLRLEEGTTGA